MSVSFVSPDVIRRLFAQAMSACTAPKCRCTARWWNWWSGSTRRCLPGPGTGRAAAAQRRACAPGRRAPWRDPRRHRAGAGDAAPPVRGDGHVPGRLLRPVGSRRAGALHRVPPLTGAALAQNPFRVFTSLLRLELIEDETLRGESAKILARRRIFTDGALALIDQAERDGGLSQADAERFVDEALETFRWHGDATSICRPTTRCTMRTAWWPTWSVSVARTSIT